jgi:PAS domain S-box-containing protein
VPYENVQSSDNLRNACRGTIGFAVAVGAAYFVAAQLGLALRAKPGAVAVFWPAAGIAVGALIALGPRTQLPVATAVFVATIASKLIVTGNLGLGITFGLVCVGQTLFTAGLIEHWFGRSFKLADVAQVLGFLVASAIGAAIAAVGAVAAVGFVLQSAASPLDVWRLWFASCLLGTVTVAPLLIGIREAAGEWPPRREMIEGGLALVTLIVLSLIAISLPQGPWATALPIALVFPVLLWIAVRCRLLFAAAAVFIVTLVVIWSTIFSVGHFGDASIPLEERVLAAQTLALVGAILTFVLAALFEERRRTEQKLLKSERESRELLGALPAAIYVADAAGRITYCNQNAIDLWGIEPKLGTDRWRDLARFYSADGRPMPSDECPTEIALKHGRIVRGQEAILERFDGTRIPIVPYPTPMRDGNGAIVGVVNMTVDISELKKAERALAERKAQLDLAGKFALVGTFTLDVDMERMQVSGGYVAIHGLPEGTEEISRDDWRRVVHPEDLPGVETSFKQAMAERRREHYCEYRIVRSGGEIRWIDSRNLISYDRGGAARLVGANIDVTERKQTEAALKEHKASLADALQAGQVMAFDWDAITGRSRRSDNAALILGLEQDPGDRSSRNEFLNRVHPDDRSLFKTHVRQLCPSRPSYTAMYRFGRPNGEQLWLEENAKAEFVAGKLVRIKGLTRDITQRKKAELILEERNVQLGLAAKTGLVGSFAYDTHTEIMQISEGYVAIHGFPEGTVEIARSECLASVHLEDIAQVKWLRSEAFREHRREYNAEYRIVRPSNEIRWVETRCFIAYDAIGNPTRIVGVSIDITERKRAEEHQSVLVAELDHRVKNVLATVSAVAGHTLGTSSSMDHFVAALDGRIRSMAAAHEVLSTRQWRGMPMAELVRRELAAYVSNSNAELDGPEVMLTAEAGQAMAMVVHELVTNAAKHGALSTKSGRVFVRWYLRMNGSSQLVCVWQETGGPRVNAPKKSGYGTGVVRDLLPYEFGGTVDLSFAPEGVRCRLEIPIDRICRDSPNISGSEQLHHSGRSVSSFPS